MKDLKCSLCGNGWSFGENHDCEKEKLRNQNEILKGALVFYENTKHWQDINPETSLCYKKGEGLFFLDGDFITCDGGEIAREALEKIDN